MKKGLIILTIILTIIISTNISIYAEEYKTTENVETTREPEQITEEVVYYTVTFIDEVRNTRVVKTVKGGEHVEPACVSAEYIYLDEVTFKYFNRWVVRKGKNITGFDFNVPITSNVELYADYLTSFETVEFNPAEKKIEFNSQGGTKISIQFSDYNKIIKEPEIPIKEGYKFLGWYTKAKGGNKWNFKKDKVRETMTLYAHWEYVGTGSDISPQTGYDLSKIFGLLIICLGTAVFSSVKLSYKN